LIDYLIAGLPRSRTACLSVFMSSGYSTCYHDVLGSTPIEELKAMFSADTITGTADTCWMMTPPIERTVCIHRDIEQVLQSLEQVFGELSTDIKDLHREYSDLLYTVEGLHIDYEDINDSLEQIWTYCTDLPYVQRDHLIQMNIQTNWGM